MKRIVSLLLVFMLVLGGCGQKEATPSAAPTTPGSATENAPANSGAAKIAVLGSKRGVSGFIDEAYSGADRAAAELGVQVDIIEIIETADYETQGRFVAETGEYDLLLFVGANVADVVSLMAADYPEQKISIVDTKLEGFPNVRSVGAKDPEQAFLSGVLCGILTKGEHQDIFPFTNKDQAVLSYAGGGDIPTSRAGAAGFMAGAKYVNPDVKTIYTIVGSWNDPAKAKEITLQNIDRGADICTGNCGSGIIGVLEACKEQGAYYIATSPADNDVDYSLCCSVKKTDIFVYNEIKGILDNTWVAGHHTFGIADGICDISFEGLNFNGKIPADILEVIENVRAQVVSGELQIPYEPNEVDTWAASNQYKW